MSKQVVEYDPAEKYGPEEFSKALRVWAEEEREYGELICDEDEDCLDFYRHYAERYEKMAEWFERIPDEFKDCEFELVECGSENWGDPIVDVYRNGRYVCSLQFTEDGVQILNADEE